MFTIFYSSFLRCRTCVLRHHKASVIYTKSRLVTPKSTKILAASAREKKATLFVGRCSFEVSSLA